MVTSTAVLLAVSLAESIALAVFITRWKQASGQNYTYRKLLDLVQQFPPSRVKELTRAD